MDNQTPTIYPLYTVREASEELGVAIVTVYMWLREGKLHRAATAGKSGLMMVDGDSVARVKAQRVVS